MLWFGGNPSPSDYPNAAIPNFNMHAFVIFSVFLIPFIAYLLILPGVRRKRVITTVTYVLMLVVGASLIASLTLPCWASGSQMIYTQFRGHSNERILAKIGVEIGLQKVNVTLKFERLLSSNDVLPGSDMTELYYNEGFDISGISSMAEALHHGLENGLPYPMLSVLEYFSLNQDAFDWGRHYRVAGHYTNAAVWFAFACWCLSVVLLFLLPHNAYKSILATGISCLIACLVYLLLSPCELRIAFTGEDFERVDLTATFSFCFYLIFAMGILCVLCGLGLGICEHWRIYTLSTFLDASLDEHVGPKWKKLPTGGPALQSVQVQNCGGTLTTNSSRGDKSDLNSDKTGDSSGFQSRTSTCQSSASSASLRSQTSIETLHDEAELERAHVHFSEHPCSSSST
ncbi:hypothetical protein CAEBREN_00575 [Caenorhabditis brenneri]|uniref:Dual oxidase maturation factor 1 n=1 Tax=Caenorhabditis brenneri TaxID=135651 RepID=G0ME16_CAEBE|nr:hypothetical protein CAEBREN_00575 [Caenorhabditis brenneri]